MVYLKKLGFHLLLMIIGIGLSFWNSWLGRLMTILYLFLFLFISPVTKKRENLWMFLMFLCISIPLNRPVIVYITDEYDVLLSLGYFYLAAVWTFEQIILGAITRMIWPKQKIITIHL